MPFAAQGTLWGAEMSQRFIAGQIDNTDTREMRQSLI
jgi:hypothetical protein